MISTPSAGGATSPAAPTVGGYDALTLVLIGGAAVLALVLLALLLAGFARRVR
ncbi:MAG: hypothetical protein ACHQ4H_02405 [Ktedonobacterales bacterium]